LIPEVLRQHGVVVMRLPCCLEKSGTYGPLTEHHVPEEMRLQGMG